jgi:tRNA-specific 2-thiouridylase
MLYTQQIYIHDYVGRDIHDGGAYTTKIRYRQPDQICTIHTDDTGMYVVFDVPQRAVASGQICVVYSGDTVVGSGVIV